MGSSEVSVYYLHYRRGAAHPTSASGDERRESVDVRLKGAANGFDWDIEAMNQTGRIGSQAIDAWAFGSVVGYTLANTSWTPHSVWASTRRPGIEPARRSTRDL